MPDNCNPHDCPVNARVEGLEKEFDRYRTSSSETHNKMFERIGALERSGAAVGEKLDSMDEKLDGLTKSVKTLVDKPGKRWDGMVDKMIWGIVGVLAGAIGSALVQLIRMGLLA